MVAATFLRLFTGMLCAWVLVACPAAEPSIQNDPDVPPDVSDATLPSDTAAGLPDGSDALSGPPSSFTHKMIKNTDDNMFSSLGYECVECTFEQFDAIVPPEGWSKGPYQVVLPEGELRSTLSLEGVPDAVDFVPEIPGKEYKLIVKNLDGELIEAGANGFMVKAQVMRDTIMRFPPGSRVHELTDPEGGTFVLFAYGIDPLTRASPNFQEPDALGEFVGPTGWTYSTRILEAELVLDTPDLATVLAIRGKITSTWEKRREAPR